MSSSERGLERAGQVLGAWSRNRVGLWAREDPAERSLARPSWTLARARLRHRGRDHGDHDHRHFPSRSRRPSSLSTRSGRWGERSSRAPLAIKGLSVAANVLWFVLVGWWLALEHLVVGIVLCLTIIGIPLGVGSFKMAGAALVPFAARRLSG